VPVDHDPGATSRPTTTLAVFDLDRTLVPGSSVARFGVTALWRGVIEPRPVVRELIRSRRYAQRGEAAGEAEGLLARLLSTAAGRDHAPLLALAASVAEDVARTAPDAARQLIAHHRRAGHVCVVLSASPHELVDAIARRLGADMGIGTRTEVRDGRLTGHLDGPFCHGAGKLARLRDVFGTSVELAVAYSDSMSDLPLLSAAARPVAVNPDRRLAAEARRRGWPILDLA
jgi:HAD superfamily hydrolase (TIGR01490 family)